MNLLSAEKSPYLLQHKDNPVFWHAWNDAAFERAMLEDKPVFLSIGYSTCHWCHVMAHESFEDPATAAVLNANFVSVKVDREERPDVDAVYMAYVQATTGSGGWPMSVFLTPDRKPFYGGTYFPPAGRGGLPGFAELLRGLAEAWRTRRSEITASADSAAQFLNHSHAHAHAPAEPDESLLRQAADDILSRHDAVHGGFGGAPKFPMPHTLSFLLRVWKRAGRADALAAVERTLDAMAAGGIYDRIGGGFHRYSTDREWRVPHYEKMLYDQALLVPAYLEAYQAMKSARYAEVARQTLDYVLRDMTSPEGGFYSAEDADSLDAEGRLREGAYYEAAAQERAKLPRPHRDEKILTDWNGLMIAALADGARVLGEVRYLNAARRAERFIEERLRRPDGTLLHRYCDGQAAITATLDDHAFFMRGLLALYDATLDASYLSRAEALAQALSERFFDVERPGFFMTERGAADLIARPRSEYDGALPAGGSAAVHALVRLSALTGDERWRGAAERVIRQMSSELAAHASGYSAMLSAVDAWVSAPVEVTLGADALDETAIGMIKEINSRFLPDRVVRLDASRKQGGGTAAHLCRDRRCLAPVRSAGELAAQLDAGS